MSERNCIVDDCQRTDRIVREMCSMHYQRFMAAYSGPRYRRTEVDPVEMFWSKVEKTDHCWIWRATRNAKGYGRFRMDGRFMAAHRIAYRLTRGPFPDDYEIDHLCRNPSCVNPEHLEPVTGEENRRRQMLAHPEWGNGRRQRARRRAAS